MPYTMRLSAGTFPDEDYVKPILDRLSPAEEALHVCLCKAFQAISQYHQVLKPSLFDDIPLPAVGTISMSSQTVDHTPFCSSEDSLQVDWASLQQRDPVVARLLSILHRTQSLDQLRQPRVCLDV